MTTRQRHTTAAAFVNRLWSLVPSGGSLPEGVWRARHRFLVGLTFFHVVIIALAGPVLACPLELAFRALLDDGSALHVMGEALVVALFGTLACWRQVGRTIAPAGAAARDGPDGQRHRARLQQLALPHRGLRRAAHKISRSAARDDAELRAAHQHRRARRRLGHPSPAGALP